MKVKYNGILHNMYILIRRVLRRINTIANLDESVFFDVNSQMVDYLHKKERISFSLKELQDEWDTPAVYHTKDAGYFWRYEYVIKQKDIDFYEGLDYEGMRDTCQRKFVDVHVARYHLFDFYNRPRFYLKEMYFKDCGDECVFGVLFHETKGYPPVDEDSIGKIDLKDEEY